MHFTPVLQLHRGHLNGLQVAIKQLRSGTCDLDIAEQLLLEEAALMQVLSLPSSHAMIRNVLGFGVKFRVWFVVV
jgi:hypothetical protein